jgi:magnesium chelatase subunit D
VPGLEGAPAVAEVALDAALVLARGRTRDPVERVALGRRARSLVRRRHGRSTRERLAGHRELDIAIAATLRAAAVRTGRLPVATEAQDLRRHVREARAPLAVCLVVDNSYSVHAERLVETVKGVALRLLEDATGRGDRVALVAFRGGMPEATVALPLTRSATRAGQRLREVPISGRTPLADALVRAHRLLARESVRHPRSIPLVVAVTDGLPTVPLLPGGDPLADAIGAARALRRARIPLVVVDTAPDGTASALSCGRALAEAAGGTRVGLAELTVAPSCRGR